MKYLAVPYREKDECKRLGGRWDYEARCWFCRDEDVHRFTKWKIIDEPARVEKPKKPGAISSKPAVPTPMTDFSLPQCSCEVPPWEDCEHTFEPDGLTKEFMARVI
jgi:hypothetical protein